MGDMKAAEAMLAEALNPVVPAEGVTETPVETETETPAETETPVVAETPVVPEAKPDNSEAEKLRVEIAKERLLALRQRRERERAVKGTTSREDEFKKREAELERREAEQKAKWKSAYDEPEKTFENLGLKPELVLQRLHDRLVAADTPEAKQRAYEDSIKELIKKEVGSVTPEVQAMKDEMAAIKKEREAEKKERETELQQRAARQMKILEDEFYAVAKADDKFKILHAFYDKDKLVAMGRHYGNILKNSKLPYDNEAIVNKILDEHMPWWDNVQKQLQTLLPAKKTDDNKGKPATQESKEPAAIGNGIVATTASGETRKLSKDERMKLLAKKLDGVQLTSGLR